MSMKKLKDNTLGKISGGRYYFRKYGDAYGMYCERWYDTRNDETEDVFDKLIDGIDATNIKDECIANPDINLIPKNDPIPLVYLSERFKGNPLCWQISMKNEESVRSTLSTVASKIL